MNIISQLRNWYTLFKAIIKPSNALSTFYSTNTPKIIVHTTPLMTRAVEREGIIHPLKYHIPNPHNY